MTTIGYARVSTEDQCLELQLTALRKAGCDHIEQDHGVSGASTRRQGLDRVLAALKAGDTLVVWKLDRLGRSLAHLIELVATFKSKGIGFKSLTEGIDTSTAMGEFTFHIFGALAQFERALISERTLAGMKVAKASGIHCGRPAALTPTQTNHAAEQRANGKSLREIARILRVSHMAVARALERQAA